MPRLKSILRSANRGVEDLLFPPACAVCGELLPPMCEAILCPVCIEGWNEARLAAAEDAAISAVAGHAYLVHYRSGKTDGVPERLIYHLKHKGDRRTFAYVAGALALGTRVALTTATAAWEPPGTPTAEPVACDEEGSTEPTAPAALPPLVTYPPRRRAGIAEDGFDQAECLARALAREIEGEFVSLLRRTKHRETEQKTLDVEARAANASCAYALREKVSDRVHGRTVILCDDLSTTGATLAACARLLTAAGAAAVIKVTVAQTEIHTTE